MKKNLVGLVQQSRERNPISFGRLGVGSEKFLTDKKCYECGREMILSGGRCEYCGLINKDNLTPEDKKKIAEEKAERALKAIRS